LLVGDGDGQGAGGAGELLRLGIELEAGIHGEKLNAGRGLCLIYCGGIMVIQTGLKAGG
jgi:hypothetical protein